MGKNLLTPCALIVASALLLPSLAKADEFSFTISGKGITSSGTFTTDRESNGSYLITSISGFFNGSPISLLPVGSFDGNDNLLHAGPNEFEGPGISFSVDRTKYNLTYLDSQSSYVLNFGSGPSSSVSHDVTFTDPSEDWGNWGNNGGDGGDNDGCRDGDNGYGDYGDGDDDCGRKFKKSVTPESPSILLLATGLGICLFVGAALKHPMKVNSQSTGQEL